MSIKKSMDTPANADGLFTWDSCIACDSGDKTDCACPACNMGDDADCLCCNNTIVTPAYGDPGSGPDDGSNANASPYGYATMKAAPAIMKINAIFKDIVKAFTDIVPIEKGWLGGTSQTTLDNGDFLWVSTDGKTRKLPIAIHGKVSVDGWLAAWNVLHGGMGGANFSGGPSKSEVMKKLMSRKPAGITIQDGHASRASTKKSESTEKVIDLPTFVGIEKSDVDVKLGIIFGKASVANIPDRQGDVISEVELEKAAYGFMANANKRATNTHREDIPGKFVASYVANGEWVVGFKPDDINIAKAAARGEFVGWSIGGMARSIPISLTTGFSL